MKISVALFVLLVGTCLVDYSAGLGGKKMPGFPGVNRQRFLYMNREKPFMMPQFLKRPMEHLSFKRDTSLHGTKINTTLCVFVRDISMLSCNSPLGIVECEAVSTMDKFTATNSNLFGIERLVDNKFNLYPRKSDNTVWMKNRVEGNEGELALFNDQKNNNFGLSVKDNFCYGRISDLLQASTRAEPVYLESDSIVSTIVMLVGELFVEDTRSIVATA